jgi:4-diphosphocytidyl-2-C-methyl-D-erythritol kinase
VRELAPAKINLCLLVGESREDGLHELVSLMSSVTLCDELEMADAQRDETLCPGVDGPNLVQDALAAFRAASGWDGPPQRITITKRIPVAAGMGGGSADAAAALRMLVRRSGLGDGALVLRLAVELGSDVPSQLRPGRSLVGGGGELVTALADPVGFGAVVLPSPATLSTAAVYREADRLGLPRSAAELATLDPRELIGVNDLEVAAVTLEPSIAGALERVRSAGASIAMVCGSGPTVVGLFDDPSAAARAAADLREAGVDALAVRSFPSSASAWD